MKKLLSLFTLLLLTVFLVSCKSNESLATLKIDSNDTISELEFDTYLQDLSQDLTDAYESTFIISPPVGTTISRSAMEASFSSSSIHTSLYFDALMKEMKNMVDLFSKNDEINIREEFELDGFTVLVEYDGTSFRMNQYDSTEYSQMFTTTTDDGMVYGEYFLYDNAYNYYYLIRYLENNYFDVINLNSDAFQYSHVDLQNHVAIMEKYESYRSSFYHHQVVYNSETINFDMTFFHGVMTELEIYDKDEYGNQQMNYVETDDGISKLSFNVLLIEDWTQLTLVTNSFTEYKFLKDGLAIHTSYPTFNLSKFLYYMYELDDISLTLSTIYIDDQAIDISPIYSTYESLTTNFDSYVESLGFTNEVSNFDDYLDYFFQYPKIIDKTF